MNNDPEVDPIAELVFAELVVMARDGIIDIYRDHHDVLRVRRLPMSADQDGTT